ncbi:hypothetical protein TNCV_504931 [Trichonephila clavipes]|nr:hypothetical protein TNCV_504931 [Trichonephila clavipes]
MTNSRRVSRLLSMTFGCDFCYRWNHPSLATPTFSFHVHQSGSTVSIKATQHQSHYTFSMRRRKPSRFSFPMMFNVQTDEEERIFEKD